MNIINKLIACLLAGLLYLGPALPVLAQGAGQLAPGEAWANFSASQGPARPLNLFHTGLPVNSRGAINDGATNSARYIVNAATYANANKLGLIFSSGANYRTTPIQYGGSNPTSGTATASIAGTTMTVSTTPTVQIAPGQSVTCGTCAADTVVTGYIGRTAGWIGTYTVNNSQSVSSGTITVAAPSVTGSISDDVLAATVNSGRLNLVDSLVGTNIIPGTTITAQLTGSAGLSGTYRVSYSQTGVGAGTSIRAYPYTVVPIPNFLSGATGGESQTVLLPMPGATSPHALVKIVNPPALGAVLGFQIANLRIDALSQYGNPLMMHGFSATSAGGIPAARNLSLSGGTAATCNLNLIANAPGGVSWGIIEASFVDIEATGATVCDYNLNGDNGDNSYSIQSVLFSNVKANSASSGNGWNVDYANITCIECLSQNHAGVPIAFDHTFKSQWIFYSEADTGGAITSTVNTAGVWMRGSVVADVDAGLRTCSTCDIDTHIGAGVGTFPTNTRRNSGVSTSQNVIVNGTLAALPSASTGVFASSANNGAVLTGRGAVYDVSLVNKNNDNPVCGVLTGTRQLSCNAFDIGGKAITLGGGFTMSGAFGFTGTLTGATAVTFPTSGTLAAVGADTTYAFRANNLSDLANAATARTNLGVTATGADTTYAFRANNLSDLANASTARTNLGLGTAATVNTGTSGATIPLLNAANTWAATQAFAALTATTINGNTFTTGTGTLTIGAGKTLTASNTVTFTGTDGSSVAFGAGGTILYSGGNAGTPSAINLTNATALPCGALPARTGDVTAPSGSCVMTLATAQPAVHTWALAQTFTVAPVFTDASGTRTALGLVAVAASGSAADLSTGTLPAGRMPALTGGCTTSAGAVATTCTINTPVQFSGSNVLTFAAGSTQYIGAGATCGGNTVCATPVMLAGTVKGMTCYASTAPGAGQTTTCTLQRGVSGAAPSDTTMTCTISGTATVCGTPDTTHTFSVAVNDVLVMKIVQSAGANVAANISGGLILATTSP
jgi:hypothetical protein